MPSNIIVVEDDTKLRYAYAKLLENAGYTVHQFGDYRGVTELLDSGCGDLLLADILLPAGTPHGIALAAMAQVRNPALPVVFVTGYADFVQHVPEGATALFKPVPDDVLLETIKARITGR
jgi:DNA-binding NtrC family response regulator